MLKNYYIIVINLKYMVVYVFLQTIVYFKYYFSIQKYVITDIVSLHFTLIRIKRYF